MHLLQALKDYGAGEIFGIPGDFALPLFRQIERLNTLPLYTLSLMNPQSVSPPTRRVAIGALSALLA